MLDIGLYELLIVGVVALIVVGPKELPGLLRTIGKYVGMVRRQASEFRAHFDDAIKDTEFEDIKREVDAIRNDTSSLMRDVEKSGEVKDTTTRKYGSDDYEPNYNEEDLDWLQDHESKISPAEQAANAARASKEAQRPSPTVNDRQAEIRNSEPSKSGATAGVSGAGVANANGASPSSKSTADPELTADNDATSPYQKPSGRVVRSGGELQDQKG